MRRLTHALACLYALAAVGLIRCAMDSADNGATLWAAFYAAAAVVVSAAIVEHAYHRDELHTARVALERAARPPGLRPITHEVIDAALTAACCERWWTSAGTEHDTDHCARKDTSA
ncbi:hypothetical protein ABZ904_08535 [Streptomyces sp. NPDC046900]|uniref:hypothetical protein n=1 Tax=Streptomyces sp. NPDC046900 TaxID=3155473 RepID=UPI0033F67E8E